VYERFTARARRAIELAGGAARSNDVPIGTNHLLFGIIRSGDPKATAALTGLGVTPPGGAETASSASAGSVELTFDAQRALELAHWEALELSHNFVEPVHLMLGLDLLRDSAYLAAIERMAIRPDDVRPAVVQAMTAAGIRVARSEAPTPAGGRPVRLFVSYSHRDERHRRNLESHLASARRTGLTVDWYDRKIAPGAEWSKAIDQELGLADVIVLLLSADFLASDYCYGIEMERALQRHRAGEARVIPVVVRECDWKHTPIGALQALPTGAKAIATWRNRDRAWLDVVDGIRSAIAEHA
jgi:hypothetical protein